MVMPGTDICSSCGKDYETSCVRNVIPLCPECEKENDQWWKRISEIPKKMTPKEFITTLDKIIESSKND